MTSFPPLTTNMGPLNSLFTEPTSPVQNDVSSSSRHSSFGPEANSISQTRISTPDLTTSPASSTSSISLSSAPDERLSLSSADFSHGSPTWADLNPLAQPFVPGSLLMHNPILSKDQLNAQQIARIPVDYDYLQNAVDGLPDFEIAPLSDLDTFSEEPLKLLENGTHLPSAPAYPPGLQVPPTYLFNGLPPPPAVPPSYLPLIADCLRPGTQYQEIESYSRVIVTSRPRWNLESLLELSERICFEMYNPCIKLDDKVGRVFTACDSARFIAIDPTRSTSKSFFVEYERGAQRQHAVATVVKHLNQHLSTIHSAEAAQLFMWSLRESALTRFCETWDIDNMKGRAMSLSKPATSYDVRCALTLCKSIASLFNQKLIMDRHIMMCISILLKHLTSVEHVEALALLILGCGPTFWDVSDFTSTTRGIGPYANDHREPPRCTADLVRAFLSALLTSVTNFSLHDSKSLVFPPEVWGEGQLMTRLNQIEVAVKDWTVLLSRNL